MLGTVFCYFIAISFGIAMPIILVKISLLEDEAKVIELEQNYNVLKINIRLSKNLN